MRIIGIAGGSGAGKSTVSYALVDDDPEQFEVINLDDYQKHRDEPGLPMLAGMINWDHPDIIRWDDLIADVKKLQDGDNIIIESWAHRSNPDYAQHRRMISRTIAPRPVVIIEGYLALYHPRLNQLFDKKFYLDLDTQTRAIRRDKSVLVGDDYETKVLEPMFTEYVEPTKHNANLVIDVSDLTVNQVAETIKASLE